MELSIVVPSYNEEEGIRETIKVIKKEVEKLNLSYEVIFVNDGSRDKTLSILRDLSKDDDTVHYISFSRNFGHQQALKAGLNFSKGRAVVSLDCDLQHPPELICKLVDKWKEGYDVVNTIRVDSLETPFFKRLTSYIFYEGLNFLSDIRIEQGAADFRLLDRKVVNTLCEMSESTPFYRGLVSWVGYRQTSIKYTPNKRFAGETKYTFIKMLKFAILGITSFSIKPLRMAIFLGSAVSFSAFVYLIYALFQKFYFSQVIPGWTSVLVSILFLGGVQLVVMGIIGEYLGKLFKDSKNRPSYIIDSFSRGMKERSLYK